MADGGIGEAALATEVMGAGETAAAATALTPELMSATGALGTVGGLGGLGGLSTVGAGSTLAGSGLAGLANVAPEAAAQTSAALAEASPTLEATQEAVRNQILNNAVSSSGAGASQVAGNIGNAVSSATPISQLAGNGLGNAPLGAQLATGANALPEAAQLPSMETLARQVPAAESMASAPTAGGNGIMDWWNGLSSAQKMLYGGSGLMAANTLFGPKAGGVPAQQSYSGPLSRFQYDPSKFKATAPIQPTPYQPVYQNYQNYADGGMLDAGANPGMMMQGQNDPLAFQSTGVERMASGGAPQGAYQIPNHMSAIDSYVAQANSGDMATVMAKAKSGDQNAMIALNRLQSTPNQNYSGGGISSLGSYSDGGRMLKGPGDGMSDDIPATIADKQPARLANDEFVVPADVVSHLGNGSSDAGAKQLYKMMDRVRQARTGNKTQGKEINPDKYMPA